MSLELINRVPPVVRNHPQHALACKIFDHLIFERTCVRVYEAVLSKCEMHEGSLPCDDLQKYQREEFNHFLMLKKCLEALGIESSTFQLGAEGLSDSTEDLLKAAMDPRLSLVDSIEALKQAECADRNSWILLTDLAADAGHLEMAEKFRQARHEEEQHVSGLQEIQKSLFH